MGSQSLPFCAQLRHRNRRTIFRANARDLSILNESTSSFRYPCLVHVIPVFLQAWTMPSPCTLVSVSGPTSYSSVSPASADSSAIYLLTCASFQSLRVLGKSHTYPNLYCIDGITFSSNISLKILQDSDA